MTTMIGQMDALALLADDPLVAPPKFTGFPTAAETLLKDFPLTCPACGQTEPNPMLARNNHSILPIDTARHGFPVCSGMNLTLNHVTYYLKTIGGGWGDTAPYPCCHDKYGIHGKKISKPTRAQYLDHARFDLARAAVKWKLHLPSLIKAVGELRKQYGITPDEAPVTPESDTP